MTVNLTVTDYVHNCVARIVSVATFKDVGMTIKVTMIGAIAVRMTISWPATITMIMSMTIAVIVTVTGSHNLLL